MTDNHEDTMIGLSAILELHDAAVKVQGFLQTVIDVPNIDPMFKNEMEVAQALIETQDAIIIHFNELMCAEKDLLAEIVAKIDKS